MDSLLLAKIATAIIAVVGLSLVAERVSPRVAGILSGYPLGTAIALFLSALSWVSPLPPPVPPRPCPVLSLRCC